MGDIIAGGPGLVAVGWQMGPNPCARVGPDHVGIERIEPRAGNRLDVNGRCEVDASARHVVVRDCGDDTPRSDRVHPRRHRHDHA